MSDAQSLAAEILAQIRAELKEGFGTLRDEATKTCARLDATIDRLDNLTKTRGALAAEHRQTMQRVDSFADELVRMRTRDMERLTALESAVAELQRKVG